jgi:hypothetical protein
MKTIISYLCILLFAFIGYVQFNEKPIVSTEPKQWQPSYDGIMEINSLKIQANKEFNRCRIEQIKIETELKQVEKIVDTLE